MEATKFKRPAPAIIPKELEGRKLVGIVHGERVDKAHNLTPEVFTVIRFVGRSENVKKKGREFLHAIGHAGGKQYFLIFE